MSQEQKAVLEEVEFISKKRYANFEGCAFHLFTFRTADEYKINKLRTGKLFNKDYKEVNPEKSDEVIEKTIIDEIAELEAILKQKRLDAGITDDEEKKEEAIEPGVSPGSVPEVTKLINKNSKPEDSNDQFNKMIDALEYDELKAKVKEAMEKGGIKINLNSGKEALRDYLKGK